MFFQNYTDLNNLLFNNLHKIPNVDLIVGIPRSGMIVATMLSEYLDKPCCDLYSFLNGVEQKKISITATLPETDYNNCKTILLTDDTIASGRAITNAKNLCMNKNVKVITFVPYVLPSAIDKVDIYLLQCFDHYFPWNIFKRPDLMPYACVDIDGVICPNVPAEFDDDGEKYKEFLTNDKLLVKLQQPVGMFVSGRLEKYRNITETWLSKNNIQYKYLILLKLNNNIERSRCNIGEYKGQIYMHSNCKIFIESSMYEARQIFATSRRPVYCTETGILLQ